MPVVTALDGVKVTVRLRLMETCYLQQQGSRKNLD